MPGDTLDDVVDIVTALRDSGPLPQHRLPGEVTDADDAAAAVRAPGLLDVLCRGDIACEVRPPRCRSSFLQAGPLDRSGRRSLDNARAIGPSGWAPGSRWLSKTTPITLCRAICVDHGWARCAGLSAAHGRLRELAVVRVPARAPMTGRLQPLLGHDQFPGVVRLSDGELT